jgi:hypothetical protein
MAHYGRLRDYRFGEDVDDIRGASLYGLDDEKLGKIDDVIFDHASGTIRYAVVDSGGWLSSKKFLVSADRIQPDAEHKDDFYVRMTKEQIEALPSYDEDKFSRDAKENERDWSDYDHRYRKSLETSGDVLHREGSTHTITQEPQELPAKGEPLRNEDALNPQRLSPVFSTPEPNTAKTRLRPSGIAARAEDSAVPGETVREEIPTGLEDRPPRREPSTSRFTGFEDHLRRNRVDITATCGSCAVKQNKVA